MVTPDTYLDALDAKAGQMISDFATTYVDCEEAMQQAFSHLAWILTTVTIRNRREVSAAALASRIIQHSHAARTLLRSGHIVSASVILRSSLESVFAVAALANDANFQGGQDFFLRLLYKSKAARVWTLKNYLKDATTLSSAHRDVLQARLQQFEKERDELKDHKLEKISELAKAARMEDFYAREYALFSDVSHSDFEDVASTHVTTNGDNLGVVAAVLEHAHARETVAHLICALMETATALIGLFKVELPPEEQARQAAIGKFYGEALQGAQTA